MYYTPNTLNEENSHKDIDVCVCRCGEKLYSPYHWREEHHDGLWHAYGIQR